MSFFETLDALSKLIQCGKNAFPTPDIFYTFFILSLPTPIAIIRIFNIRCPRQKRTGLPQPHSGSVFYPYTVAN